MNKRDPQYPFRMLLQVAGRLRSEDLETFRSWVPFLEQAQWVGGRMIMDSLSMPQSEALGDLVERLLSELSEVGEVSPGRIACFFMADWERLEVSSIEQVFNLLAERHPQARLQALLLDSEGDRILDLVLVAG